MSDADFDLVARFTLAGIAAVCGVIALVMIAMWNEAVAEFTVGCLLLLAAFVSGVMFGDSRR